LFSSSYNSIAVMFVPLVDCIKKGQWSYPLTLYAYS